MEKETAQQRYADEKLKMEKEKAEQWRKFCQAKDNLMLAFDMEIMKCRLDDAGLKVIKDRKSSKWKKNL